MKSKINPFLLLTRNHSIKKTYSTTTLKPMKHIPWMLGLTLSIIAVDVYYYFYEYESPPNALLESVFQPFKLIEKNTISKDTVHLKLKVNNLGLIDYLSVPNHVVIKDDSCQIARPYTPIVFDRKYIDILVKEYPNGQVSRYLHSLDVGDVVHMRGPVVTMPYKPNIVRDLGMVAAGTGIAPMYQLLKSILSDPADQTRIHLVYANKSFQDILLYQELELLEKKYHDRLTVYHTIESFTFDKGNSVKWTQGTGRITKEMLALHLPKPSLDSAIIVCGPDGFMQSISGLKKNEYEQGPLEGHLNSLGYSQTQVYKL